MREEVRGSAEETLEALKDTSCVLEQVPLVIKEDPFKHRSRFPAVDLESVLGNVPGVLNETFLEAICWILKSVSEEAPEGLGGVLDFVPKIHENMLEVLKIQNSERCYNVYCGGSMRP